MASVDQQSHKFATQEAKALKTSLDDFLSDRLDTLPKPAHDQDMASLKALGYVD